MTKKKLIVADDHPIYRDGLEVALKKEKTIGKITHAANGKEVLELLSKEHYDIVLMDIRMPVMDGVEAIDLIQKKYSTTKVIVISVLDNHDSITKMIEKGASGYLTKRAEIKEVLDAVKKVLDGKTYLSLDASRKLMENIASGKKTLSDGKIEEPFANENKKERYREIAFLISREFTSKEIAACPYLSVSTIETDKKEIKHLVGHFKITGITDFAKQHGIADDPALIKKFKKALEKKKLEDNKKR